LAQFHYKLIVWHASGSAHFKMIDLSYTQHILINMTDAYSYYPCRSETRAYTFSIGW
ncbi:hypothetical protein ACJX0J_026841, partial [Zea mays]